MVCDLDGRLRGESRVIMLVAAGCDWRLSLVLLGERCRGVGMTRGRLMYGMVGRGNSFGTLGGLQGCRYEGERSEDCKSVGCRWDGEPSTCVDDR